MSKSSTAISGPLLAVDFLIGCCFPLAATVLDIWWKGQPFSFAALQAAQTSQPLLWIIDSIPLLLVFWRPSPRSEKKMASALRSSAITEQQITERTAKLTKQVAELKSQVLYIRQEREELRVSEELYRSLVENAHESMFTLSMEGSFTSVNSAFTSLLGKHQDDLRGRHCSIILPAPSVTLLEAQMRRFQQGEKAPTTLDLSFFHQNGKTVEVEARFLPIIDTEGVAMGMQSICRVKAPPVAVSAPQHLSSPVFPTTAPISLQGSLLNSTPNGGGEPSLFSPSLSISSSFYQEGTPPSALVTPLSSPSVQVSRPAPMAVSQSVLSAPFLSQSSQPPTSNPVEQILDLEAALGRVDGDRELLVEMADLFLDEYPRLLSTLRDAVAHGNAPTAAYAAHTLKGSVANFAAMPAFTAAQKIERIARQGDLAQVHAAFADLEEQLKRLTPVLTSLKIGITA